jgi:hypothetical protein
MKHKLQIPSGWTFAKNPESIVNLFPPKLPEYKGMLFIVGSHEFFSVNASVSPDGICYVEKHLRKKYGDKAVEWVLYSIPHTNYLDNKKIVRNNMCMFPEKDNLFLANDVSAILEKIPPLSFLDESEAKKERAEKFCQALINFIKGKGEKKETVISQELLQGIQTINKFVMEDWGYLNLLLDTFIQSVCLELAFHRELVLEFETEECLENERERFPYLEFDENGFEVFRPLTRIFPWFKYVAFELSKEIIYIKPNPEDVRYLFNLLNGDCEDTHPLFLCNNKALGQEWCDDEPSESFSEPLVDASRGHDGGGL